MSSETFTDVRRRFADFREEKSAILFSIWMAFIFAARLIVGIWLTLTVRLARQLLFLVPYFRLVADLT